MAAANGEVACMRVLHQFQAALLANESGNLPTHWAAQNGRTDALKFLIDHYEVDMLTQNRAGRSVLTEAFQSQNSGDRIRSLPILLRTL